MKNKPNILLVGEHPFAFSGNAHMLYTLASLVDKDKYDLKVFAGLKPDLIPDYFGKTPFDVIEGIEGNAKFCGEYLCQLLTTNPIDVVVFVGLDCWAYHQVFKSLVQIHTWKKFIWCSIFPYDLPTIRQDWFNYIIPIDIPCVYSEYGLKILQPFIPKVQYFRPPLFEVDTFKCYDKKHKLEERRKMFPSLADDTFVFGFVGNNQWRKDPLRAIRAFFNVKKTLPNSIMYMHTEHKQGIFNIPTYIVDCGGAQGDIFLKPDNTRCTDMTKLYNALDCLMNTSLQEGLSWTLLEAMLCIPEGETIFDEFLPLSVENHKGNYIVDDEIIKRYVRKVKKEPIVKIKTNYLPCFSVTSGHPIQVALVKTRYDATLKKQGKNSNERFVEELGFKTAEELVIGDWLVFPKLKTEIKTDLKPNDLKFLGLYLAEGWTDKNNVCFGFNESETNLIDFVRNYAEIKYKRKSSILTFSNSKGVMVRFTNASLAQFLRDSFNHLAKNKIIPGFIMTLTKDNLRIFLQAYIDGDGCVVNRRTHIGTVSKKLAYQLILAFSKLDVLVSFSTMKNKNPSCINGRTFFSSNIGYRIEFSPSLNIKGGRKKKRYLEDINNFYIQVNNVKTLTYTGTVHNFETKSNKYRLPFLTVHNCGCPIIATDNTAQTELIKGGATLAVPCTDLAFVPSITPSGQSHLETRACNLPALEQAMIDMATKPDLRESFMQKGLERGKEWLTNTSDINILIETAVKMKLATKVTTAREKGILFAQHSSAGDVLMTTQCFKGIKERHKNQPLIYMTQKQYQDIIVNNPYIDQIIDWDESLLQKYEAVYNPHGEHILRGRFNRLDVTLYSLYPYFCKVKADEMFIDCVDPHIELPKIYTVVHTTGGDPRYRTYNHMDIVVNKIGMPCVQVGGVLDKACRNVIDLRGKLSFRETAFVMKNASIAIVIDSFLSHLAGCLNTPVVTLFGPAPARVTRPKADEGKSLNIEPDLLAVCPDCGACWGSSIDNTCQTPCINTINPSIVIRAAKRLLK